MPFDANPHPETVESAYAAQTAPRRRTLDDIDRELAGMMKPSHVGLATMSGDEGPSLVTIAHSWKGKRL